MYVMAQNGTLKLHRITDKFEERLTSKNERKSVVSLQLIKNVESPGTKFTAFRQQSIIHEIR